jgi:hypothetical protein
MAARASATMIPASLLTTTGSCHRVSQLGYVAITAQRSTRGADACFASQLVDLRES